MDDTPQPNAPPAGAIPPPDIGAGPQLPPQQLPAQAPPVGAAPPPPQPPAQLPPRPIGTSGAGQPTSKAEFFRDMLGKFFYAVGTGLANRGSGPEADSRGAGAAITALPELAIRQQQLQTQQEFTRAHAASITPSIKMLDPQGNEVMVPPANVGQALGAQYRLAGQQAAATSRENVANINQAGGIVKANILAQNRLDVEKAKVLVQAGQISRIVPVKDEDGQPAMEMINKFGRSLGFVEGAIPPASLLGKTSSNQRIEKDENGNYVVINTTSTSRPNLNTGAIGGSVQGGNRAPQAGGTGPTAVPINAPGGGALHAPLSQPAKTSLFQIRASEGLIDQVKPDLEAVVKEINQGGNLWDSTKVRSAWKQYQSLGIDPSNVDPNSIVSQLPNVDPRIAKLFPTIAMLQVMGAQPYLRGVRRFEFIKQIQQHLPDPEKDTPQLMVAKLNQLSTNLPLLEKAVYAGEGVGQGGNAQKGALSLEEAQGYLQKAGGDKNKARALAKADGRKF